MHLTDFGAEKVKDPPYRPKEVATAPGGCRMDDDQQHGAYDGESEQDDLYEDEWPDEREDLADSDPADGGWGAGGAGALVAAALAGAVTTLVLVLVWTAFAGDGGSRPDDGDSGAPAGSSSGAATTAAPLRGDESGRLSRLGRCVRAQEGLQVTLDAAQPALDQWEVHVGAMNKLVVGEITLRQATEFWERTRVGAQRRVREFDESLALLRAEGVDCPAPTLLARGARVLPACAREVQAAVRALQAARVSVSTWDEHIHHMDMLRLGEMTPEQATEMWLSSWRRGVRDLDDYEAASGTARQLAEREDGCG